MWNVISKVDELKFKLLDQYNQNREALLKKMNALQKKHKELKNEEFVNNKKNELCSIDVQEPSPLSKKEKDIQEYIEL